MARPSSSDGWGPPEDLPSDVQVTIITRPQTRTRIAFPAFARIRGLVALALALMGLGAVIIAAPPGARPSQPAAAADPRTPGMSPVAAADRYPLGCLGASFAGGDRPSPARRPDSASPCWRYGVYLTAIFHQVRGIWRIALEAVSPSCPAVALPAFVRAQVALCVHESSRRVIPAQNGAADPRPRR